MQSVILCVFRCGRGKYVFVMVNKMMLTSLGEYFSATVLSMAELSLASVAWEFASLGSGVGYLINVLPEMYC